MNKEQEETQSLRSSAILPLWKKIFSQISKSLLHRLSCSYILSVLISDHRSSWDIPDSDWSEFFIFKLFHFVMFLLSTLLLASAIVYTIACISTSRKLNIKKMFSVVSDVWERLFNTFLWSCIIIVMYNVGVFMIMGLIWIISTRLFGSKVTAIFVLILSIFYFVGLVYLSLIWQFACMVSISESVYGLKAMMRSQDLMKGKMGNSVLVGVCGIGFSLLFGLPIFSGGGSSILSRISFGVLCLVLQMNFMIVGLVTQTIIFFVLRSFRHVDMDKSSFTDDLQLEYFRV